MDANTDLPVKLGPWTNKVSQQWLWLLPTNSAGIAVQFLGIWLTLALPRIWTAAIILYRRGTSAAGSQNEDGTRESVPDPGEYALDRLWDAGLPRNRLPSGVLPRRDKKTALQDVGIAFMVAMVFVLVIVTGTLTTLLSGDSTAIASSKDCGYYHCAAGRDLGRSALTVNREREREETVAAYARNCYNGRGSAIDGCNLFTHQSLPYAVEDQVNCPFGGDMCVLGNERAAVKFSTPPLPAHYLGLNTDKALEFVRTTTCAPLIRNASFIGFDNPDESPGHTGWWYYFYGATRLCDCTMFYQAKNLIIFDNTYSTVTISQRGDLYQPIEELRVANDSVLTLVFVDVSRIAYHGEVRDPVFYARDSRRAETPDGRPGDETWSSLTYWRDIAPRILACVDGFNMRNRHISDRWLNLPSNTDLKTTSQEDEWKLLYRVLSSSTVSDVTWLRSGNALNASSRVLGAFSGSLPLPEDHWKLEARQWFETSLANAQFEARRVGLGLDAADPWYERVGDGGSMCDYLFLVNAAGYMNVYLAPWLTIFIISLFIIVITFPVGPREHRKLLFEFLPDAALAFLARWCVALVHNTAAAVDWILRTLTSFMSICWAKLNAIWRVTSAGSIKLWKATSVGCVKSWTLVSTGSTKLWKDVSQSIQQAWTLTRRTMADIYGKANSFVASLRASQDPPAEHI